MIVLVVATVVVLLAHGAVAKFASNIEHGTCIQTNEVDSSLNGENFEDSLSMSKRK